MKQQQIDWLALHEVPSLKQISAIMGIIALRIMPSSNQPQLKQEIFHKVPKV